VGLVSRFICAKACNSIRLEFSPFWVPTMEFTSIKIGSNISQPAGVLKQHLGEVSDCVITQN